MSKDFVFIIMYNFLKPLFIFLLIILTFTGCKDEDFITDPFFNKSESDIFKTGLKKFSEKNYSQAIDAFEAFEGLYPLSEKVSFAQKFEIVSHYKSTDFIMTKAACDRFLLEHPRDINADYIAYLSFEADYMIAMNYPMNFLPVNRAFRETSSLKKLYVDSLDFFEKYPLSPYIPNVAKKIPLIRKMIAEHELFLAKYMLSKHQYFGFMHQNYYIQKNFPGTTEQKSVNALYQRFLDAYSTEVVEVV